MVDGRARTPRPAGGRPMPCRITLFGSLAVAISVGLFALTPAAGQAPPPAAPPVAETPAEAVRRTQEENARQYKQFAEQLRALERKWANSDDPGDRERAKTIADALK